MDNNFAYLATDIGRLFRKRLDCAARPIGVTGAQLRVLLYLDRKPGANQVTLASFLEVEPITAGRMIDRMVAAELVERRADPEDRRAWLLFATAKGDELLARMGGQVEDMLDLALDGLSVDERNALISLLDRVRCNLLMEPETVEARHG
ncbi:MarR family transcriptional regulator [Croceicoccus ponticola]|uniref:MarR family transcriptional regulator n=1 Tax=Croceicoccus ponticola TaxID=2217664 RepID=A0A437GYM5_9SPHN|nr:MarR family transcriptional regulator [Croceicoccus ponticola]RVQ67763.1 MarR family transcriptional regulator [Croceicoccus ponticola]